MEKYYKEFDDTEENKFCYTDIHREYVRTCDVLDSLVVWPLVCGINKRKLQKARVLGIPS